MEQLWFGTAYDAEGLPEERLERDMKLMAEAGMNLIAVGGEDWGALEPREGEYRLSPIAAAIEAAERRGLRVLVHLPTGTVPPWLARREPETVCGPYRRADITHPAYLQAAKNLIRELVKATAAAPNVAGYRLDAGRQVWGARSPRMLEGFRDWMAERFPSPEALAEAYGPELRFVGSFGELPDPAATEDPGYRAAFEEYRRLLAARFLKWESGIAVNLKREDQILTYGFTRTALGPAALSWHDAAPAVSLMGAAVRGRTAGAMTGREAAFAGDLARGVKHGPFLALDCPGRGEAGCLPYPGQLRLAALGRLAAGAAGLVYDGWASPRGGAGMYRLGLLPHSGEPDAVYAELKETGALLRRLFPALAGMKQAPKAAIVLSAAAPGILDRFPTERGLGYGGVVDEFYAALYELNLPCDLIYDRETDWSPYRLLVFPQLYSASDAFIARVRDFTAKGGTVLASFRSFFADEHLRVWPDAQPHGLTDLFGMRYSRFTQDEAGRWMELLEPKQAAVAGRYGQPGWNGLPAATRCRFGKGHAWYLGTRLDSDALKDFLLRVCETAEIHVPSCRFPLVCRQATAADGAALWFFLNYAPEEARLRSPAAGTELLGGGRVSAGQMLSIEGWGAAILRADAAQ